MPRYLYEGDKRREIVFPLGGIGAGSIGLDGTGRLRDFEIFNRPSKGSYNGYTHFAIKAERGDKTLDARVLNADLMPPYTGRPIPGAIFSEYGFGPSRYLMSGVPHMRGSSFFGCFPTAEVRFSDESFPGRVTLKAFSPFIPLDDKNSSLPAAFFTLCVENPTDEAIEYTGALSLNNPMKEGRVNTPHALENAAGMLLEGEPFDKESTAFGQLAMAVSGGEASYQQYWYRGGWFDNLSVFWQDFTAPGALKNRVYPKAENQKGHTGEEMATLAARIRVAPGETREVRFLIGWYFPNCENYWSRHRTDEFKDKTWKNYYATLFGGAIDVVDYCMKEWDGLETRTRAFVDALQASTVPDEALEALTSNLSVLKSPTCLRLTDGSFYGWEGCHATAGSCEGSCTHVWNYAFAMAYLFPKLERSMRELDYTYNLRDDGGMPFRLQLPIGSPRSAFRPCVDGQMGGVIKTYREWKVSGNDEWLRKWWPKVQKSLEFAWSAENADRWDPDKTGIITGRQHHTLDMELFGPNAWLNTFYLAALKAASEMAEAVGEEEHAQEYRMLFEKGKAYTDDALFNGEYYFQKVDIRDAGVLAPYSAGDTLTGGGTFETYWNSEAGQLKYQIGEGCGIDQVLAQWMADVCGLGDVLDRDQVRSALAAIYRYNFKESFRNHFNPCRIYGLNDESGLAICEWPEGREKPVVPIPYAEESMHGFEYQAACHMIGRGLVEEGLRVVRSIRNRYDGEKRNPWNEFECGSNYARSMASWALLNTYAGFKCDMTQKLLSFNPIQALSKHNYFFSIEGAWGNFSMNEGYSSVSLQEGALSLRRLELPEAMRVRSVTQDGAQIAFDPDGQGITFETTVSVSNGHALEIWY